ncbi:MAG: ThiF family adenylyltransferase [Phycisphaerae bacterium]|nr:ThiF family adenylyltransferase [Phycisphaerae bacterium]
MIVISSDIVESAKGCEASRDLFLGARDNGDVYNALMNEDGPGAVPGTLHVSECDATVPVQTIGKPADRVRVIAFRSPVADDGLPAGPTGAAGVRLQGFVLRDGGWQESPVLCVPVKQELHSRISGLLETDVLKDKCVFEGGLGSGGAPAIMELAKAGVGRFLLMDHDRLEVANITRHIAGLADVGRYKTKVMAELIRGKNPDADVQAWETKICWDSIEHVRQCVRTADLVLCGTDEPVSRNILNSVCVEEDTPLIMAGAFRRAYGGQVLRVRPHRSPCYQCFVMSLPDQARDHEIATADQAQRIAYSDRDVPIEPGLSTDIAPISQMVAKLGVQELLQDEPTTMRSLDEDLVAPWYIWINRREQGTEYEKLPPLGFSLDGFRILRWYGIELERRPDCPCCGDFIGHVAHEEGIEVAAEDLAAFEAR